MTITTAQESKLNKMCNGAKAASLGTALKTVEESVALLRAGAIAKGVYTVTAGDVTATKSVIPTGLTAPTGFIVQITRSGVVVGAPSAAIATTNIEIATNSTIYVLTAGDAIAWMAF